MSKVELNTQHGPFELKLDNWSDRTLITSVANANASVELEAPDWDDPRQLAEGCSIVPTRQYGGFSLDEAMALQDVMAFAIDLAGLIEEASADAIVEAKKLQAEAEAERQRERDERVEVLAERKERLLTEFLGEKVKVRDKGNRSMVFAVVESREEYDRPGEFKPYFQWTTEHIRSQNLEHIRRLDVKLGGSWATVWDDGYDDLYEYDRPEHRPLKGKDAPTGKMYDEMEQR